MATKIKITYLSDLIGHEAYYRTQSKLLSKIFYANNVTFGCPQSKSRNREKILQEKVEKFKMAAKIEITRRSDFWYIMLEFLQIS